MPNHIYNTLISNNLNVIKALLDENGNVDFNQLIPMPKELEVEDGSITQLAITYYVTERLTIPYTETNLDSLLKLSNRFAKAENEVKYLTDGKIFKTTSEDELYALGKRYVENIENFGFVTWYGWCCKNWGTKWNAYAVEIEDETAAALKMNCENDSDLDFSIGFYTAWDAPYPIFEKLFGMFPTSKILVVCQDEEDEIWYLKNDDGDIVETSILE